MKFIVSIFLVHFFFDKSSGVNLISTIEDAISGVSPTAIPITSHSTNCSVLLNRHLSPPVRSLYPHIFNTASMIMTYISHNSALLTFPALISDQAAASTIPVPFLPEEAFNNQSHPSQSSKLSCLQKLYVH